MANYDILRHYLMNSGQLIGSPIAQGISKRQDLIRDQEQQELQRRMMESQMRAKQQAEMARREHELGLQRMKGEDAIRKSKADAEGWATSRQQVFGPLNEAKAGLLKSQTELTGKRVGNFDREQGREDSKLRIAKMRLRAGKQPLDPKKIRIKEIMNELRILENSTTDAAGKRTDELQNELDNLMGVSDQPKVEEQQIDGQVSGQSEAKQNLGKPAEFPGGLSNKFGKDEFPKPDQSKFYGKNKTAESNVKGRYGVSLKELGDLLNLDYLNSRDRPVIEGYISTYGADTVNKLRTIMRDTNKAPKLIKNIELNKSIANKNNVPDVQVTADQIMNKLKLSGPVARAKVEKLLQVGALVDILDMNNDELRQLLVEIGG